MSEIKTDKPLPLYNSVPCQGRLASGKACTNMAYYHAKNGYFCGVHTKIRIKLPSLSIKEQNRIKQEEINRREKLIEQAASENAKNKQRGQVKFFLMKKFKPVIHTDGYLSVFPNYRDGGRKDGLGCPSFSPMLLGPVMHGQPNIIPALTIEGFHQFSKQYENESDEEFERQRIIGYSNPNPSRHKRKGEIPKFIWIDKHTGIRHSLDWTPSKQFYCNFWERLTKNDPVLIKLKEMVKNGTNVTICGYDAKGSDYDKCAGHEMCLYYILTEDDETKWPWRIHKTFDF